MGLLVVMYSKWRWWDHWRNVSSLLFGYDNSITKTHSEINTEDTPRNTPTVLQSNFLKWWGNPEFFKWSHHVWIKRLCCKIVSQSHMTLPSAHLPGKSSWHFMSFYVKSSLKITFSLKLGPILLGIKLQMGKEFYDFFWEYFASNLAHIAKSSKWT